METKIKSKIHLRMTTQNPRCISSSKGWMITRSTKRNQCDQSHFHWETNGKRNGSQNCQNEGCLPVANLKKSYWELLLSSAIPYLLSLWLVSNLSDLSYRSCRLRNRLFYPHQWVLMVAIWAGQNISSSYSSRAWSAPHCSSPNNSWELCMTVRVSSCMASLWGVCQTQKNRSCIDLEVTNNAT